MLVLSCLSEPRDMWCCTPKGDGVLVMERAMRSPLPVGLRPEAWRCDDIGATPEVVRPLSLGGRRHLGSRKRLAASAGLECVERRFPMF